MMREQRRQWTLIVFGVFAVAVIVSLVSSGTVSDLAFVVYVVAFVILIALAGAWMLGRGKDTTAGQP
jgi:lipopolysaccharide export LptBFGC system permease protein LptF